MKKIFDNASKGWKTTLIGITLLISALAYLFVPMLLSASHPEFNYEVDTRILLVLFVSGVGLVLLPDTLLQAITKYINNKTSIILLLLTVGISSCVSYSKCQRKFGSLEYDTLYVTKVDTVLQTIEKVIPGDSLFTSIQLDSLLSAPTQDTITIISDSGRGQVQFWKDKYNNYLNAKFTIPPDTIRDTLEVIVEVQVPCPPPVHFEDKGKWYDKYLTWVVLAVIVYLAILLIKSR